MSKRILSTDEIARRGHEVYRTRVMPTLSSDDYGKYVLIDVLSEAFVVGRDEMEAAARLREQVRDQSPDPQVWFRRVGTRAVRRYGRRAVR